MEARDMGKCCLKTGTQTYYDRQSFSAVFISDFISDIFKNFCRAPVNVQVMQIYFCCPQVLMAQHFLCFIRVMESRGEKMPQAMRPKMRDAGTFAQVAHEVFYAIGCSGVGSTSGRIAKNIFFRPIALFFKTAQQFKQGVGHCDFTGFHVSSPPF